MYDLIIEIDECFNEWDAAPVNQLNPEAIKSQHKKMTDTCRKLLDKLANNKDIKDTRKAQASISDK